MVNFDATFNEQRHLFDTNHNGTITVGELRALAGVNTYTNLYTSSDASTKAVTLATIVSALDASHDGLLQLSEVKAFLATDSLADTEDKDYDGKLDAGYEIARRVVIRFS